MTVINAYENIKNEIGQNRLNEMWAYLHANPNRMFSDIFYNKEIHAESIQWAKDTLGFTYASDDEFEIISAELAKVNEICA